MKDTQSQPNYFLFTGAPGAGKTTTLKILKNHGYSVVKENARRIIKEQYEIGGNATHQGDKRSFCQLMLEANISDFQRYESSNEIILFDRGLPGLLGYKNLSIDEDWGGVDH
jgi:predicted ATPase